MAKAFFSILFFMALNFIVRCILLALIGKYVLLGRPCCMIQKLSRRRIAYYEICARLISWLETLRACSRSLIAGSG
jgi:hypothetical protein